MPVIQFALFAVFLFAVLYALHLTHEQDRRDEESAAAERAAAKRAADELAAAEQERAAAQRKAAAEERRRQDVQKINLQLDALARAERERKTQEAEAKQERRLARLAVLEADFRARLIEWSLTRYMVPPDPLPVPCIREFLKDYLPTAPSDVGLLRMSKDPEILDLVQRAPKFPSMPTT